MSLRTRLLVVVAALTVVGLVVANVATYEALRSFLIQRLDRTVNASAEPLARSAAFRGQPDPGELQQLSTSAPGSYVGLRFPSGTVQWGAPGVPPGEHAPPPPQLPDRVADRDSNLTLGATHGSTRYRARIEPIPGNSGYLLIVASPLKDVYDMLLLARLDQGRPLDRKPVDLAEVAGDAVDAARAVDPDRPLELEAEPVVVEGDPERLRQVIDNLLANVRSHTPPGTPARVRVGRDNSSALVEVADEGPGLTEEQATHAFERFYRGSPSRSRDGGSSGLGLSIVAAIAQAHGGAVDVSSGPGATFRVVLPLERGVGGRPFGLRRWRD